jgi:hypothetical protein
MSVVSNVGCTDPAGPGDPGSAQPAVCAAAGSLMPDPDAAMLPAGDALSLMYFLESRDQRMSVDEGSTQIRNLQDERNLSLVQERNAVAQKEAAAKSRGFWGDFGNILGDVAKVAGIVAAVAVTVCTAGGAGPVAALAIAGIILSSASFVDGEFHVLQKLGVDPKVTGWVDTGMAVAGAVCSFGAGAASAGSAAVDTASTVARMASVTSGVASMVKGGSTVEEGLAESRCDEAGADAVQAEVQSADTLRFMGLVISETESSDDSSKQIMSTVVVTKGIQDTTAVAAAMVVKG